MYRFLFFYANMIVNKNEVLNKVKLKLKLFTLILTPLPGVLYSVLIPWLILSYPPH